MTQFSSCIQNSFKQRKLLKGTLLALIGAGAMVCAGTGIGAEKLSQWGWLIYSAGFGLIAWGLIPYRRLSSLEMQPHRLVINSSGDWLFSYKGKLLLGISGEALDRISYSQSAKNYGIKVHLKRPITEKIKLYSQGLALRQIRTLARTHNCDLFFPFFSKRTFMQLEQELKSVQKSAG